MKFFLDAGTSHYQLEYAPTGKQKIELVNFNKLEISGIQFNVPPHHQVFVIVEDQDGHLSYFQFYAQDMDRQEKLNFGSGFLFLKMRSARFDYQKTIKETKRPALLSWDVFYP